MENLKTLLCAFPEQDLQAAYRFWNGHAQTPVDRQLTIDLLCQKMTSRRNLSQKIKELGRKLNDLLRHFVHAPEYAHSMQALRRYPPLPFLSNYELDSALAVLAKRGLLIMEQKSHGIWRIPKIIGDRLFEIHKLEHRTLASDITMKGYLEQTLANQPASSNAIHKRQTYKLFMEAGAIAARIQKLPAELRALLMKVVFDFGGILPRSLFYKLSLTTQEWQGQKWKSELEKNCLGTIRHLSLNKYGLQHKDVTLIIFHEVTLAVLRTQAQKPVSSLNICSVGVDLVSNIDRFIAYLSQNPVKFTLQGDVFRSTERKITDHFLEPASKELSARELLHFIYQFSLNKQLIDKTGERIFVLSPAGRNWESASLQKRLAELLEYVCEERSFFGGHYHQLRLRRALIRLLKHLTPGMWYDAMSLPFIARNSYLIRLDHWQINELVNGRSADQDAKASVYFEDLQQVAWNLFAWVRKRLHPLGLVDFAYDQSGRPRAMRLSEMGAQLLTPQLSKSIARMQNQIIINPDFEVVLFPGKRPYEFIHQLDRICVRLKADKLYHYRITEESLQRALAEGFAFCEIMAILQKHSKVEIPQNVIYTLRSWSEKIGILTLAPGGKIYTNSSQLLQRFIMDPRVKPYVAAQTDSCTVVMKKKLNKLALRNLILEVGYFVDIA